MGKPIEHDDLYLDAKHLCGERIKSISKGTLRAWKSLGLPFYSVGGKDLYYWPEIKEWVQNYRTIQADLDEVVKEVTEGLAQ